MAETYENKARPSILQESDKFNKLLIQTNGRAKQSWWIKQHVFLDALYTTLKILF
jgi:hypothetical protein